MRHFKGLLATAALINWGSIAAATETLTLWYHGAGNALEGQLIGQVITDFNASQTDWRVELHIVPALSYTDLVMASAAAGTLPDILDVDAPVMPYWVWTGILQPLQIDPGTLSHFLPGTKGVYDGKLYTVGLWDFALSLVTRQSILDSLKLRTPTLDKPWTGDEFEAAMKAAKASGRFKFALDLGTAWKGEWYAYAYLPFLQSFGGDLIDRSSYATATGALNGEAAQAWGNWWQHLFTEGYAQAEQDPVERDVGFTSGDYAFSWNGDWTALQTLKAFPDTVFLPAPNFGTGPKIGAGSWQFGVSAKSVHADGAAKFIAFAVQDKYLAEIANGIGLMPATSTAAAMVDAYKPGGPLAAFFAYAQNEGVVRPVTPGYEAYSKVFEKAATDISTGAAVAATLDAAVTAINADIAKNKGYAAH